jgi:hypothetical protein
MVGFLFPLKLWKKNSICLYLYKTDSLAIYLAAGMESNFFFLGNWIFFSKFKVVSIPPPLFCGKAPGTFQKAPDR